MCGETPRNATEAKRPDAICPTCGAAAEIVDGQYEAHVKSPFITGRELSAATRSGKIGTRYAWPYDRRDWLWLARLWKRVHGA